jgi:uncharacterized OB-fold protein
MSEFRDQVYRHATYGSVKSWRERLGRYRVVGSRCVGCEAIYFPRRPSCASCQGREMAPYQCSHTGTVVVAWPQINLTRLMGYADLSQRQIAIVRLDDGIHIETEIVDVTPQQAQPGLRVRLAFRKLRRESNGNEMYGYKFAPVEEQSENPETEMPATD